MAVGLSDRSTIRAVVVDAEARDGMRLAEIPPPAAARGQVLVDVHHVSLNHGDLNDATSGRLSPGAVLGSDAAGVVLRSEGHGPRPGTRVVALAQGAFAEQIAVDVENVAEVPAFLDLAVTATLPVAGLAAVQALRAGGLARGKRVLVTGASGGVGRFAVAVAAADGAHVTAAVGSVAKGAGLTEIGAAEVVVGLDADCVPFDLIIDTVGGPQMVAAWERLAPGGDLQSVGWASGEPAVFAPYATVGPPRTISSFLIQPPIGENLAELVSHVGTGRLRPEIGWRGPFEQIHEAVDAIRARRIGGKVILDVRQP